MDYNAHHNEFGRCPAKGRKKPVNGETYSIAKFKYHGDTSTSGTSFSVVDIQSIVYQVPFYSEEELLRMNNLFRTKGYYGKRPDVETGHNYRREGMCRGRIFLFRH